MSTVDKKLKIIRKLRIEKALPSSIILPIYFEHHMHKKLDLNSPITFNEKLQWLKMNYKNPLMTELVDKIKVRDFVKQKIGSDYLIPLIGIYDDFDEIDFKTLPDRFVIKCNHDSGSYIICTDKNEFDIQSAKEKIKQHMNTNYFYMWREWPYKNVVPQILIEPYMEDIAQHSFNDYKILCFNGVADNVMVCSERQSGNVKRRYFDREWNFKRYNYEGLNEPEGFSMDKPERMEEMFRMAEKLSEGFPCVRVDLYCINNKIYFGEMTFFPWAGYDVTILPYVDKMWGKKIELKKFSNV